MDNNSLKYVNKFRDFFKHRSRLARVITDRIVSYKDGGVQFVAGYDKIDYEYDVGNFKEEGIAKILEILEEARKTKDYVQIIMCKTMAGNVLRDFLVLVEKIERAG